jgi:integrase
MALDALTVKGSKPQEKSYRLYDTNGLYLEITPKGGKLWRLKYRYAGKEKLLSFGSFPSISLKEARALKDEARKQLANEIDPSALKKELKRTRVEAAQNSFEFVAREWISKNNKKWSTGNSKLVTSRFERLIFPLIGKGGSTYTAHKVLQNCGQVFRYSIATGRSITDPSAALKGALPPTKATHHASITDPKKVGALLRAIKGYEGTFVTKQALKLAPLVIVRPGELRHAEWQEIDLETAEWRIPADKMKMKAVHIVPLSSQAISIIEETQAVTGNGKYVFPSVRSASRPMSENTINASLRRMGYTKEEMTGHGFRSMASTLLNEQGWHWDAIERQLAHAERNSIRAAYNYAEHMPERIKMMQHWADYLEGLANGADVISIKRADKN